MKITYINKSNLKPALWSQGETYEYYIYPTNSSYQARDFILRISSATINSSPATFTNFDGYLRFLAMLDNNLKLEINDNVHQLEKYDLIDFHSTDKTISYNIGQDFNVMVKDDYKDINVSLKDNDFTFTKDLGIIFSLTDTDIIINNENHSLKQYDVLVLENISKKVNEIKPTADIFFVSLEL